jgi:hypothetical protein
MAFVTRFFKVREKEGEGSFDELLRLLTDEARGPKNFTLFFERRHK